ncbi:hypothetical protein V6N13_102749 [Hibiscus sabdariffa]
MLARKDAQWVHFLRSKYKCLYGLPHINNSRCGSRLWKALNLVWADVMGNLSWNIANGKSVDFCFDQWIHGVGPLANHVPLANRGRLPKLSVAAMVDEGCTWRWALFQHLLPLPVLLRIAATKDPSPLFPDDEVGWGLCSDLRFWVKSAYEVHRGYASGEYERIWTTIHSFRGLPKIKLMTNAERYRRHFSSDAHCPVCRSSIEDVDHILRRCSATVSIWTFLIRPSFLHTFLSMPIHQWFILNLSGPFPAGCDQSSWDLLFAAVLVSRQCDCLWGDS